jgi:hypothetical protein
MSRIVVSDLIPASQYAVQVRAIGYNSEVSEWSPRVVFTTLDDVAVPATPSGVTIVSNGDAFHAEWSPVVANINGEYVPIAYYEAEVWNGGSIAKIVSVSQQTTGKLNYDLSFENNVNSPHRSEAATTHQPLLRLLQMQ